MSGLMFGVQRLNREFLYCKLRHSFVTQQFVSLFGVELARGYRTDVCAVL